MPKKVRKPNFYERRRKLFYPQGDVEKSKTTDKPKKSLDEVLAEYRGNKK